MGRERPYKNREWLQDQIVTHRKSLTALSKEIGVCITTLCKWVRVHGFEVSAGPRTPDELRQAIEMRERGEKVTTIAKMQGVSTAAVIRALETHGYGNQGRARSLTHAQYAEVVKRYQDGESQSDLSKAYGVCATTISHYLANAGVRRKRTANVLSQSILGIVTDKAIQKRDGDRVAQEMIYNILQPKEA